MWKDRASLPSGDQEENSSTVSGKKDVKAIFNLSAAFPMIVSLTFSSWSVLWGFVWVTVVALLEDEFIGDDTTFELAKELVGEDMMFENGCMTIEELAGWIEADGETAELLMSRTRVGVKGIAEDGTLESFFSKRSVGDSNFDVGVGVNEWISLLARRECKLKSILGIGGPKPEMWASIALSSDSNWFASSVERGEWELIAGELSSDQVSWMTGSEELLSNEDVKAMLRLDDMVEVKRKV